MDVINLFDFEINVGDAERLVRWFEEPEAKILSAFLASQLDNLQDAADKPVGDNPLKDVLFRERCIGGKVAINSIKQFPEDIRDALNAYNDVKQKGELTDKRDI